MLKEKLNKLKHYLIAVLAYWYYGRPARKLIVIGVTGTKGKSTVCRLVASILEAGGYKVGMLTTVEFQIGNRHLPNTKKMTMLGLGQIQKMLRSMVRVGCQYAVVETSSEGILQSRHYGLNYDVAIFTNLGTEHSERHGGFENLRRDKGKMFSALNASRKVLEGKTIDKIIIANADDSQVGYYLDFPADKKVKAHTDLVQITHSNEDGVNFVYQNHNYILKIAGDFNVANAVLAIEAGKTQNIEEDKIAIGLANVKKIRGRMEFIRASQDFMVIVDYAHEPISLTALFKSLRTLVKDKRVISVIGSDGGGRDVGKRSKMGEVAGELCDVVIITDVNCFDEDPCSIAEMLAQGARQAGKIDNQNLFVEIDRQRAFGLAFSLAKAGDVVVLTAKGNESCICVANGKKIPWDDYTVAKNILTNL